MARINWYPRYPADFLADTDELTMAEVGIYNTLLDKYYYSGGELTRDYYALYGVCRSLKMSEKETVRKIVDRFFPVSEDGQRHNRRADRELEKIVSRSDQARGAVNKRWKKT